MPGMPLVQPGMTWLRENFAGWPRSHEESNCFWDWAPIPTYCAVIVEPAATASPVPTTRSHTVSVVTPAAALPTVTWGLAPRSPVTLTPAVPTV